MKKEKFYITTSIPYTNAAPHVGHVFEFIQADVVARHQRSVGKEVYFLTGSDEHGLKTKRAAEALGKTAQEFADETSQKFRDLKSLLNLSTDDFIRTTDEQRHLPAIEKLWKAMQENGDLYKKKFKGFYCPGCEAFKTDKELVEGNCIIHQKPVEEIEEENYFFKLSSYLPKIKEILENGQIEIIPSTKKNEMLAMIEQGLDDVSFSRDKDKYWGFSVPGDESQVIYVWADALPNYISAIGYGTNEEGFGQCWPADVHCIGKDIVKFHALYWPAMLLSLGLELPRRIFVHGHINFDGQKMSKSLGNVVDPFELVKKYGIDAVRYYLLREITPTEDGDFTYEKFEARYNSDLAGGVGNLLARTVTLAAKFSVQKSPASETISVAIKTTEQQTAQYIEEFKFSEALKSIWELVSVCDRYINEHKPWEGKENAPQVISDVLAALDAISGMLAPFLPDASQKMKNVLETQKSEILFPRLQVLPKA